MHMVCKIHMTLIEIGNFNEILRIGEKQTNIIKKISLFVFSLYRPFWGQVFVKPNLLCFSCVFKSLTDGNISFTM